MKWSIKFVIIPTIMNKFYAEFHVALKIKHIHMKNKKAPSPIGRVLRRYEQCTGEDYSSTCTILKGTLMIAW